MDFQTYLQQAAYAALTVNRFENPFPSLYPYLEYEIRKKRQANFDTIALDWVEKPFVPQAGDRVVDHFLHALTPASSRALLYLATGSASFILWMVYTLLENGIPYVILTSIWSGLHYGWHMIGLSSLQTIYTCSLYRQSIKMREYNLRTLLYSNQVVLLPT